MQFYNHTLPSGAALVGYLRDETTEMPAFNIRPAILILPGGGYAWCSSREADPVAMQFLQAGYNVFILTYTCRKDDTQPPLRWQPLIDAAGAILHIRRNAAKFRVDPFKVAVCGFSAGGHLAAHYATSYDCAEVRAVFSDSKPVQASILGYPVITADPMWAHLGSINALTGTEQRTAEEIAKFSCDKQVRADTPPAFLWHTAADSTVPVANSLLYVQALAANKIPFELHVYPFGDHGLATCDDQTLERPTAVHAYDHAWLDAAKKWLRLSFKTKANGSSAESN